ncbi:MAG TPA: succinylglutamate desuccinylase/aspartoacylase family protein, partial [Mariniphaga sp.]|nr:succinylglutamate desuccinylase/aspartoacylase family protein [Mariniphaga sp.]
MNKVKIDYATASMVDGRIIHTPFWRVDSGRDGPSLVLIASQHGNEVQGAEVARRFMEVCDRQLIKGNVWLIPMANILAVRSRRHSFDLEPEQDNAANPNKYHNMQRHWPGNPDGNDTSRLAYSLDQ